MLGELNQPAPAPERHRLVFSYLFSVYLLCAIAEGLISPLFPLLREDLGLEAAQQAVLAAALVGSIAVFNVIGGALAQWWWDDRTIVRLSAAVLATGMAVSGAAASFASLLAGQVLVGVAFGLFFPSGLSSIARLYVGRQGRAIASYGLAYSAGLALAAVSANVGQSAWRLVFFVSAGAAAVSAAFVPRWESAPHDTERTPLVRQLRSYLSHSLYRVSAATSLAGIAVHYLVIGFSPTLFVDRGRSLRQVSILIAVGRLGSIPGKVLFGAMFDRRGGLWTTRLILAGTALLGLPLLLLPPEAGVWLLVPFVALSASVFPIANALLVAALPARSSWGIGTFRALVLGASALLAAAAGAILHVVSLPVVMVSTLALPLGVAWWVDTMYGNEQSVPAGPTG